MTPPTVVFLHGLARTSRSLRRLRRHVADAGFETWARTYPSRKMALGDLADTLAEQIAAEVGGREILAVTHSLGGIIVRQIGERLRFRRIVMLAPPNGGSRVAAAFRDNPVFRWYFGPTIHDLAGGGAWPVPSAPVGIIAGTRGATLGNLPSWLIAARAILPKDEPHDGTVTVAETRLPQMAAFATVGASHTWIMNHPETRDLVVRFLTHGSFDDVRGAWP